MLSRVAESLYWIGRYVERAEDTARITDVNYHHTLEIGALGEGEARRRRHWEALLGIVGDSQRFFAEHGEATEDTVPPYLTFDTKNSNSIISCVARARENARTLRHEIDSEMWEVLNRFYLELQGLHEGGETPIGAENAHLFYQSVKEFSHLFQGYTDSTMPREEGWYFLQAGKFLERAEKTARAVDVKYHLLVADVAPAAPVEGPGFQEATGTSGSRFCARSPHTRPTTSCTGALCIRGPWSRCCSSRPCCHAPFTSRSHKWTMRSTI